MRSTLRTSRHRRLRASRAATLGPGRITSTGTCRWPVTRSAPDSCGPVAAGLRQLRGLRRLPPHRRRRRRHNGPLQCPRGPRDDLSLGEVSISAERSQDASIAAASGQSSRPSPKKRRAAAGHARPHQPGPPRPASASTSSRRPTPYGSFPPLPDQVPEGRDRGRATFAPFERGATLRRQCPERSGTAVGTSRQPARRWRRQIAQQLPLAPPGRPLGGEPPQRPAPATRHRGVQPSAVPPRGRRRAGDGCTREPQAQGRRQRRGTSPRPARSQPARRWSPNRQYSRAQPGGRLVRCPRTLSG